MKTIIKDPKTPPIPTIQVIRRKRITPKIFWIHGKYTPIRVPSWGAWKKKRRQITTLNVNDKESNVFRSHFYLAQHSTSQQMFKIMDVVLWRALCSSLCPLKATLSLKFMALGFKKEDYFLMQRHDNPVEKEEGQLFVQQWNVPVNSSFSSMFLWRY